MWRVICLVEIECNAAGDFLGKVFYIYINFKVLEKYRKRFFLCIYLEQPFVNAAQDPRGRWQPFMDTLLHAVNTVLTYH
jgi:hypothetical protein